MSELNKKTLNPEDEMFAHINDEFHQEMKNELLSKGSVNNLLLIRKYCPSSPPNGPYTIHKDDYLKLVNDIQANGGSPEVDNPVGQVSEHNILDVLPILEQALNIYDYNKHRLQLYAHLAYGLNSLLTNKPLETTKEQPKLSLEHIQFINKLYNSFNCTFGAEPKDTEAFEKITGNKG